MALTKDGRIVVSTLGPKLQQLQAEYLQPLSILEQDRLRAISPHNRKGRGEGGQRRDKSIMTVPRSGTERVDKH